MKTLTVTSDLRIEVDNSGETPLLCIYSEGMREDGETGVIVWPNEIQALIDVLAQAASILAQDVTQP